MRQLKCCILAMGQIAVILNLILSTPSSIMLTFRMVVSHHFIDVNKRWNGSWTNIEYLKQLRTAMIIEKQPWYFVVVEMCWIMWRSDTIQIHWKHSTGLNQPLLKWHINLILDFTPIYVYLWRRWWHKECHGKTKRDPERFVVIGIDPPKGLLLHGPPDTDK